MATNEPARRARVPTHVPGLDIVLGGGLLRGGVYVVRGAPGSGKTILGNQICFAHAKRGGHGAYVTLLAESHARMMLHLESMDFFDPAVADDAVRYLSAYSALTKSGLRGVLDLIRAEVQADGKRKDKTKGKRARRTASSGPIVVVDGFLVLSESSESVSELKKFIQELQLYADLVGATVLLLAGPAVDESRPEYTMVDGIIELREELLGLKAYRALRVRKFRGGVHLVGGHVFQIADDGITVYPRVEALYGMPSQDDKCGTDLIATGVAQLDSMLGGGLLSGTTTLILGPSGSGKTTLGLHYITATPKKERAVWFGFYETPERLLQRARTLNLRLDAQVKRGEAEIIWQPSTEQHVDQLAQRLLSAVDRLSASRVFIDGLDGFQRATAHPERVHHVFTAVANELRVRGVTTVYSYEVNKVVGAEFESPITGISALAENLLYLRFVEIRTRLYRLLSILKVRDRPYDSAQREFEISASGIRLENTVKTAEAILAGKPIVR